MKNKRIIVIVALVLILAGAVISGIARMFGGQVGLYINQSGIHTAESGQQPYVLEKTKIDEFEAADIYIDYADLTLIPSDGYYLEYKLSGDSKMPAYKVDNQKLVFDNIAKKGINFGTQINIFMIDPEYFNENYYVNLYVPKEQYFTMVNIQNDSGKVSIDTINAESLNIELDYGKLELDYFQGNNIDVKMDSGDFVFSNLEADRIKVKNSYGKIIGGIIICNTADFSLDSGALTMDKATISELKLDSEYGNVTFNEIACDKGEMKLDSGNLKLDNAEITELTAQNAYGYIDINLLSQIADFDLDLETDYGKIDMKGFHSSDSEQKYETHQNKGKSIKAYCDSGNIKITEK